MLTLAVIVSACWLVLGLLVWRSYLMAGPSRRARRRGGYIRPSLSASGTPSPTTAPTPTREATSTAWKAPGTPKQAAFTTGLSACPDPDKMRSLIASIADSASGRGDHTTGAEDEMFAEMRPGA